MADTYEKDLGAKSSITGSDYIRVVGSDDVSYKQPMSYFPTKAEVDALTTIYVSQVGTTSSTGWILLQYNGSNVSYNNYEVISAYNNGKILIPFVSSGNWYVKALEYGSMASVANTQLTCYFRLLKK